MEEFLVLHEAQLQLSGVPQRYWETIYSKIKQETFDAGDFFMMQLIEEGSEYEDDLDIGDEAQDVDDVAMASIGNDAAMATYDEGDETEGGRLSWRVVVSCPQGIDQADPQHVYLIDHAWTYRLGQTREQLENNPALLRRMCALMNVRDSACAPERTEDDVIEDVMREMWKYNQTYNIATAKLGTEDALPVWYIMDEFGSRIQHSDTPSVMMVPFCYVPTQTSFTIMWPKHSLMEGDEVTRDYLCGRASTDPLMRKLLLLPWQPDDMRHLTYDAKEDPEAFSTKYTVHKTTPNLSMTFPGTPPAHRKVRVYSDVDQVLRALTDTRFVFVDEPEDADIIWTRQYLSDFKAFSENTPNKFINQFPFEMILTVKDLLAMVSRRAGVQEGGIYIDHRTLESRPAWVPTTFNLRSELSQFVSYYQHRAALGLDNHWICKPFNLARGLDHWITDDLNCLLRLAETGPKIASKYVIDPVLLNRPDVGPVKFDLRFIVMVISVSPLELVVHQKFIVRVANKIFSLDHLDDYEKHFTVMNYKKGVTMKKISCEDFIEMFEAQYTDVKWSAVLEDIYRTIRELFTAAVIKAPPCGISPSPQSRSIYGIDVMLRWADDPSLLPTLAPGRRASSIVSVGDGMFKTGRYKSCSESSSNSASGANCEGNVVNDNSFSGADSEGIVSNGNTKGSNGKGLDAVTKAGCGDSLSIGDAGIDHTGVDGAGDRIKCKDSGMKVNENGNNLIKPVKNGLGNMVDDPNGSENKRNGVGSSDAKQAEAGNAPDTLGTSEAFENDDDVGAAGSVDLDGVGAAGAKMRMDSGSSSGSSTGPDGEVGDRVMKKISQNGNAAVRGRGPISGGGTRKIQPVLLECNFGPDNTRLINAYPEFFNDIFSTLFFLDIEGRPVDPL